MQDGKTCTSSTVLSIFSSHPNATNELSFIGEVFCLLLVDER
jgi:hypothetical protein